MKPLTDIVGDKRTQSHELTTIVTTTINFIVQVTPAHTHTETFISIANFV